MAANKTKATEAGVDDYFSGIEDDDRRKDCVALARLMTKATKQQPKMWGSGIVGFVKVLEQLVVASVAQRKLNLS